MGHVLGVGEACIGSGLGHALGVLGACISSK